jgi:peptide-methionine (S)-S-oxide reductase
MLANHWSIKKLQLVAISATLPLLITGCSQTADNDKEVTKPKNIPKELARATFGGGCFWCVEAVFEQIKGVKSVVSGYAGGTTENPTYDEVCQGTTGHAEICQIHYDPNTISYDELLEVFWLCHDPTTLNQQGNDVGTQYRSIIFYEDASQKKAAEAAVAQAAAKFSGKIVTEVAPLKKFHIAEEYHQDYFAKHPNDPYCAVTIPPKLRKIINLDVYAPDP